jgi:hypothetical protein
MMPFNFELTRRHSVTGTSATNVPVTTSSHLRLPNSKRAALILVTDAR